MITGWHSNTTTALRKIADTLECMLVLMREDRQTAQATQQIYDQLLEMNRNLLARSELSMAAQYEHNKQCASWHRSVMRHIGLVESSEEQIQ